MVEKRHHYVPKTYLNGFVNEKGFLWVGRKNDPQNHLNLKPENVALQRYYYSQTLPDGSRDNRMEKFFGNIEAEWSVLRDKLVGWSKLSPEESGQLWSFVGMQRCRVPAARNMVEDILAHHAMLHLRELDEAGELLPYPEGYPDIMRSVRVSIDPHKSLEAIGQLLKGFRELIGRVGFQIVHNETDTLFVTSDNPVAIFDPSVAERELRPYVISRTDGPVELLFPVDLRTAIRGHSDWHSRHSQKGPKHTRLRDEMQVRRMNRMTAKFAYEILVANDSKHSGLLKAYADRSPVVENSVGWSGGEASGPLIMAFGPRPTKPKWEN